MSIETIQGIQRIYFVRWVIISRFSNHNRSF